MKREEISVDRVLSLSLCLLLVLLAIASSVSTVYAKSETDHLYLYQKDPGTWEIVKGGAWGKMTFRTKGSTFDFVFNGHNLEPNTDYSLIYYADPWPGKGCRVCEGTAGGFIAKGTSNNGGNLHLAGSVELNTDLPASDDYNSGGHEGCPHDTPCLHGAKIWLVLSSDYSENPGMTAWNPDKYLFEGRTIHYDDTDVP